MKVNVGYFSDMHFERECDRDWEVEEEEMAESFARTLRVLRKYYGYSLKEVSEGTDIPFQTIARYEKGENIPSVIQAFKLAYFYEFSVQHMFIIGLLNGIEESYKEVLDNWR